MKKNKILIFIVLAIAAVASWFYFNNTRSTITEALRDFGVKDTGSIVKIFIADKSGKQTLLERQTTGEWLMNSKYITRHDAIKTILSTVHDVEVRSPVSRSGYNNVIRRIASTGIKVELYDRNGLIKTYYVGGPTQDHMGTFMYLENSTVPFITHVPGFDGYLTPRYIVNEVEWMVKSVFRLNEGMLKTLTVTDREQEEKSFAIQKNPDGNYVVLDGSGKIVDGISQDKVINYLEYYRLLNYEMKENSLTAFQKDSVLGRPPFRTIRLVDSGNTSVKVDLWRRPITGATVNKAMEDGTPYPFDIDRMSAMINGDTSLIVVQYYSFEKLFRRPVDFLVQDPGK